MPSRSRGHFLWLTFEVRDEADSGFGREDGRCAGLLFPRGRPGLVRAARRSRSEVPRGRERCSHPTGSAVDQDRLSGFDLGQAVQHLIRGNVVENEADGLRGVQTCGDWYQFPLRQADEFCVGSADRHRCYDLAGFNSDTPEPNRSTTPIRSHPGVKGRRARSSSFILASISWNFTRDSSVPQRGASFGGGLHGSNSLG